MSGYPRRILVRKICLRIGEKVLLKPYILMENGHVNRERIWGKIVYINKPHRYFTAEFQFQNGSFQESFKFCTKGDFACLVR